MFPDISRSRLESMNTEQSKSSDQDSDEVSDGMFESILPKGKLARRNANDAFDLKNKLKKLNYNPQYISKPWYIYAKSFDLIIFVDVYVIETDI